MTEKTFSPENDRDSLDATQAHPLQPTITTPIQSSGTGMLPSLPGYDIERELGRGGMGVVYLARQLKLNRRVALKVVLAGEFASTEQRLRFLFEAELAARVRHEHVVQVFEIGSHESQPFLALEYVNGGSLAEQLQGRPLAPRAAAAFTIKLAEAVQAAHAQGIIHRDLKPANILLQIADCRLQIDKPVALPSEQSAILNLHSAIPKITDFGLAKHVGVDTGLTATGVVLGTPSYMAPEQAASEKQLTPATDIYALGAILYELLTGRPPITGATQLEIFQRVLDEEPTPPRRLSAAVPLDLEVICLKCLAKDPTRRYASAAELAADLRRYLENRPISARPIGRVERTVRWVRRNPTLAALTALLVALAVFGPILALQEAGLADREARARAAAETAQGLETEARQRAETARNQEAEARKQALAAERRIRQHLYVSDTNRAFKAWEEGSLDRALDLLHRQEPAPGQEDFRGIEWHVLNTACRRIAAAPVFRPQGAAVLAAAITPDGQRILTADSKGDVTAWDPLGKVLSTTATGSRLPWLGITPDSKLLAALDTSGRLFLITLPELRVLKTHQLGLQLTLAYAAFSPDAATVAAVIGKDILLWDVATGAGKAFLPLEEAPTAYNTLVRFDPAGKQLLYSSGNLKIIWTLATMQVRLKMQSSDWAFAGAISPDGNRIYHGGGAPPQTVQIWDLNTGKYIDDLHGHTHLMTQLEFSRDGAVLASASEDTTIRLWNVATNKELAVLKGHAARVEQIQFAPDGRWLIALSRDGLVRRWERDSKGDHDIFPLDSSRFPSRLGFTPDSQRLLLLTREKAGPVRPDLLLLDLASRKVLLHEQGVSAMLQSGQRYVLTTNLKTKRSKIHDTVVAGQSTALEADLAELETVMSDTGRFVLGWGKKGLRVWEVPSGRLLGRNDFAEATGIDIVPDGSLIATASADGIRFWKGPGLSDPSKFDFKSNNVGLLRDGRTLIVFTAQDIQLWDYQEHRQRGRMAELGDRVSLQEFYRFVLSPSGRFVGGARQQEAWLWDLETGACLGRLRGHRGDLLDLAFSADDRTLVTTSMDGTVKIWNVPTMEEVSTLLGPNRPYGITIGPDGSLAIAFADTSVHVWRARR
jgi:WD40 repeat protein